jgi:hypothetical protein
VRPGRGAARGAARRALSAPASSASWPRVDRMPRSPSTRSLRPMRRRAPIAGPRRRRAQEQAAYGYADEQGFGCVPAQRGCRRRSCVRGPGGRLGAPVDMGERFDEAVVALSRARTGVSVMGIAQAFGQLSAAAWEVADAVERGHRQRGSRQLTLRILGRRAFRAPQRVPSGELGDEQCRAARPLSRRFHTVSTRSPHSSHGLARA